MDNNKSSFLNSPVEHIDITSFEIKQSACKFKIYSVSHSLIALLAAFENP